MPFLVYSQSLLNMGHALSICLFLTKLSFLMGLISFLNDRFSFTPIKDKGGYVLFIYSGFSWLFLTIIIYFLQ